MPYAHLEATFFIRNPLPPMPSITLRREFGSRLCRFTEKLKAEGYIISSEPMTDDGRSWHLIRSAVRYGWQNPMRPIEEVASDLDLQVNDMAYILTFHRDAFPSNDVYNAVALMLQMSCTTSAHPSEKKIIVMTESSCAWIEEMVDDLVAHMGSAP